LVPPSEINHVDRKGRYLRILSADRKPDYGVSVSRTIRFIEDS